MRRGRMGRYAMPLKSDAGVSLIEVTVAVLVLAIGVSAGMQSLSQARIGIGTEVPRLIAREVALNRAEELQILGSAAGLPSQVDRGGIMWNVVVESAATAGGDVELRISVRADGHPRALITAYAPASPPL